MCIDGSGSDRGLVRPTYVMPGQQAEAAAVVVSLLEHQG